MQTESKKFILHSEYQPTGDQFQTLLSVTGSGKTFTMENVLAALNKPTLVIAHNKTLAGQLCGESKESVIK